MSKSAEILEEYKKYLMPTYTPSVVVSKAKGSRVYDAEGKPHTIGHKGVAKHPGDEGMAFIAGTVLEKVK